MSLQQEDMQEIAFFEQIAPFFGARPPSAAKSPDPKNNTNSSEESSQEYPPRYPQEYPMDDDEKKRTQDFKKLAEIFEFIPSFDRNIAKESVGLLLDHRHVFNLNQHDILYHLCRYHIDNRFTFDFEKAGIKNNVSDPHCEKLHSCNAGIISSEFDSQEIKQIDDVFDIYADAIPQMIELYTMEIHFLYDNSFDPSRYNQRLIEMFRLAISSSTLYTEALSPRAEKQQQGLAKLGRLGQSCFSFVQNAMDHACNVMIDAMDAKQKVDMNKPKPNLE